MLIFIEDLLENKQGLSVGELLALLSGTLLSLFIFNNGMDLTFKLLIILYNRDNFVYAHVLGGFLFTQDFMLFWSSKQQILRPSATLSNNPCGLLFLLTGKSCRVPLYSTGYYFYRE